MAIGFNLLDHEIGEGSENDLSSGWIDRKPMDVLSIEGRYDKEGSIGSGDIFCYSLFVLIGYGEAVPVEGVVFLVKLAESE